MAGTRSKAPGTPQVAKTTCGWMENCAKAANLMHRLTVSVGSFWARTTTRSSTLSLASSTAASRSVSNNMKRLVCSALLCVALDAAQVKQWDRFETPVTNTKKYADPYRNVQLLVTYKK